MLLRCYSRPSAGARLTRPRKTPFIDKNMLPELPPTVTPMVKRKPEIYAPGIPRLARQIIYGAGN
jgi:hypothetical protein